MFRVVAVLGLVLVGTARRSSDQDAGLADSHGEMVYADDAPLQGAALNAVIAALDAAKGSGSEELRNVMANFTEVQHTGTLRELIGELEKLKNDQVSEADAIRAKLFEMPQGDSNSAELREFAGQFKNIFDEQFIGERLPPAQGLATREIVDKQNKEFLMTAKEMGAALLADWRKASKDAGSHDEAFDQKLEEAAGMLVYPQAQARLSITGHLWAHLTNMYMLVVRSLKELIDKTTLTWNLGDTGIAGSNLCNAAAREARETFVSGASKKGAALFEFGIKWLLGKHMNVVHDLTISMPRHKAYSKDSFLMEELRKAEQSFVDEWGADFRHDFHEHLRMATVNVQQSKILKTLHSMEGMTTKSTLAYELTTCENIPGASARDKEQFPACKCAISTHTVFCGTEEVADRKFDALETKALAQCTYSKPYCAKEASRHELNDLASILNPNPVQRFYLPKRKNGKTALIKDGSYWRAVNSNRFEDKYTGLGYRKSMNMDDMANTEENTKPPVRWGAKVFGVVAEYDDWIAVEGCDTLYKDLVDSAVDLLTMHMGSRMYYMLYDPSDPIRKNPEFAKKLFEKLKGDKSDEFLGEAFKSLGQRKGTEEALEAKLASASEVSKSQQAFKQALLKS